MKKRRSKRNDMFLGRYVMHDAMILVYGDPKTNQGTIAFGWQKKNAFIQMLIGLNESWPRVVSVALHEIVELSMRLSKATYQPHHSAMRLDYPSTFRFFFDHDQWTRIADHGGDMLTYLLPGLEVLWKKCQKAKR